MQLLLVPGRKCSQSIGNSPPVLDFIGICEPPWRVFGPCGQQPIHLAADADMWQETRSYSQPLPGCESSDSHLWITLWICIHAFDPHVFFMVPQIGSSVRLVVGCLDMPGRREWLEAKREPVVALGPPRTAGTIPRSGLWNTRTEKLGPSTTSQSSDVSRRQWTLLIAIADSAGQVTVNWPKGWLSLVGRFSPDGSR
ncbi:hypothetical protein JOE60_000024 [Paenarthrobacter ilicis]|uniref:Uncharacterized protein n=1 Tax=Paenarthrobacter ilicis TaxID=43665 RepID=A0ABX0TPE9_9MICC|nr:hypothetical protein [Paenarthrobacter ilicis]NIJ02701.1 hypothetical protein [Paenarthrobacter ilicis]